MKSKSNNLFFSFAFIFTSLSALLTVGIASLTKYITDAVINNNYNELVDVVIVLVAFGLAASISLTFFNVLAPLAARIVANRIKQEKIKEFKKLGDRSYLKNDLVIKSETLIEEYYMGLFNVCYAFSMFAGGIGFAFYMNWIVGLSMLGASIILFASAQLGNKRLAKNKTAWVLASEKFSDNMSKDVDGFIYYQFAGKHNEFASSVNKTLLNLKSSSLKYQFFSLTKSTLFSFAVRSMSFIVMVIAGVVVTKNHSEYGILAASLGIATQISSAASDLGSTFANRLALKEVHTEFLRKPVSVKTINQVSGDIEIDKISFAFDDKKIFENLSLRIKQNEKVLITGESGRGKSTLLELIGGNLEPSEGKISFGKKGVDAQIDSSEFKKMNNNFTFVENDLVKVITSYGSEINSKSVDNLIAKLKLKNVNPTKASRGELQKLKIANMIYSSCNYQLYDEPFSNISNDSLENIVDLILGQKEKTIIIVAHNLDKNIVKKFDRVIQL